MKRYIPILALLAALLVAPLAKAQYGLNRNDIAYHSTFMTSRMQYNPSFFHPVKDYIITLPTINAGFALPFCMDDIPFRKVYGKKTYYLNIKDCAKLIGDDSRAFVDARIDWFGFAMRKNNLFFSVNFSKQYEGAVTLPKGASKLLEEWCVPIGEENKTSIEFNDLMYLQAYNKLALGVGTELPNGLSIGGKLNLLFGNFNLFTRGDNAQFWAGDSNYSSLNVIMHDELIHGGAFQTRVDEKGRFNGFQMGDAGSNMGFTLDLGASYRKGGLELSFSLLDFGPGIHWSANPHSLRPLNEEICYTGADISGLIKPNDDVSVNYNNDITNNLLDTLQAYISVNDTAIGDYWYGVPTKLYLGAAYRFNDYVRVSALYHGEWMKGVVRSEPYVTNYHRSNLSIALGINYNDRIEAIVANSILFDGSDGSAFNPGIGFNFTISGYAQLNFMIDYRSTMMYIDINQFRFSAGLSVLLGRDRIDHKHIKTARAEF